MRPQLGALRRGGPDVPSIKRQRESDGGGSVSTSAFVLVMAPVATPPRSASYYSVASQTGDPPTAPPPPSPLWSPLFHWFYFCISLGCLHSLPLYLIKNAPLFQSAGRAIHKTSKDTTVSRTVCVWCVCLCVWCMCVCLCMCVSEYVCI